MKENPWETHDELRARAEFNGMTRRDVPYNPLHEESNPVRMLGGLILLAMAMAVLGIIAGVSIFFSAE